jgi:septal ring factor EnvC (AmiA/AmiB activator)
VAKDDKIGNASKSSDAICAYCSLCDTFFPYHYSSNSKAPANHRKKCPGKIALQSDEVRMQLREKEKLQEDTKQKLLEVQAELKEKEKERRQVQGQAAQLEACQAAKKSFSDELAKSNTEVGRLKKKLEISQKTTANLQTCKLSLRNPIKASSWLDFRKKFRI